MGITSYGNIYEGVWRSCMKSFSIFLESKKNDIVAVFPGRFQFPHKGHLAVYHDMLSKFGKVYITTSNKTEEGRSPFTFEEKKKLLMFVGIPEKSIVLTKSPNAPVEITKKMNKKQSLVIGAGDKVQTEEERFTFKKKDGSPSYFQPYNPKETLESFEKHGYIYFIPTMKFKVIGKVVKSASEIRKMFREADQDTQKKIIKDLYGKYDTGIHKLLVDKLI